MRLGEALFVKTVASVATLFLFTRLLAATGLPCRTPAHAFTGRHSQRGELKRPPQTHGGSRT